MNTNNTTRHEGNLKVMERRERNWSGSLGTLILVQKSERSLSLSWPKTRNARGCLCFLLAFFSFCWTSWELILKTWLNPRGTWTLQGVGVLAWPAHLPSLNPVSAMSPVIWPSSSSSLTPHFSRTCSCLSLILLSHTWTPIINLCLKLTLLWSVNLIL